MGVDGLYKFINKNFPEIFKSISIGEIKGNSCIIDGMQHIYSQLIYMRSKEKEVISQNGKNISHIHGLINSLTYYLKNGIIPIYIFDGKSPDIKKKKIEERKKNLKDNLNKLKELEVKKKNLNNIISEFNLSNNITNNDSNDIDNILNINNNNDIYTEVIYGTPPRDSLNLDEELAKINNIQDEYKKIYKKSIVMKDYFIKDWIEILELLGIPVIKADGEADPLCAYILKNNPNIYGIISDDSDMLIFGAPVLMRKSINQHFTIIELKKILTNMEFLLSKEFGKFVEFNMDNLIDFAILLGTDYGTFNLNNLYPLNSLELLKYYVDNNKDFRNIINSDDYDKFILIKKYYQEQNFDTCLNQYLLKPIWKKPKLLELKKRLLELDVDEDYVDKNNKFLDFCYNRIEKCKYFNNDYLMNYKYIAKTRSNSFDQKKKYMHNYNYDFTPFYI